MQASACNHHPNQLHPVPSGRRNRETAKQTDVPTSSNGHQAMELIFEGRRWMNAAEMGMSPLLLRTPPSG